MGRYRTHSASSPSSPSTRFRSVWRSLSQRDHLGTIAAAAITSAASVFPHLRAGLWLDMPPRRCRTKQDLPKTALPTRG